MRQDTDRLIPRHTHDAKRAQQTMGTYTSLSAATILATVWNAICSYPVHCASWADMKFVNSHLDIHRSTDIGMRSAGFPISSLHLSGIFATSYLPKRLSAGFFQYHQSDLKSASIAYNSLKTSERSDDAICSIDLAPYLYKVEATTSSPISEAM